MAQDKTIETSVDELIALLQSVDKLSLADAAKKLNVPLEVVQLWVDFLVEEKILGVEYKFTVPYVYLNKVAPEALTVEVEDKDVTLDFFKEEFSRQAVHSNIVNNPKSPQLLSLWRNHLTNELDRKKDFFYNECAKRKLTDTDTLWLEFTTDSLNR